MATLQLYTAFDLSEPNTGVRWSKWLARFIDNYLVAHDIKEDMQKKALMLLSAGPPVQDIYDTVKEAADTFEQAHKKLTDYFQPQTNTDFEVYKFRKLTQKPEETVDKWTTRLRQQAKLCNFENSDKEIKAQILQNCTSGVLRRSILRDATLDLAGVLNLARTLESSNTHAEDIEGASNSVSTNAIRKFPPKSKRVQQGYKQQQQFKKPQTNRSDTCRNCGGNGHITKV